MRTWPVASGEPLPIRMIIAGSVGVVGRAVPVGRGVELGRPVAVVDAEGVAVRVGRGVNGGAVQSAATQRTATANGCMPTASCPSGAKPKVSMMELVSDRKSAV